MSEKIRDSFIFYRSFFESVRKLPKEDKADVLEAICTYALDEETGQLSVVPEAIFTVIKPQLDANRRKWKNGCKEKQKTREVDAEDEQEISKPEAKDKQTVSKPEGNVNDNVNVNVECKSESKSEKNPVGYLETQDNPKEPKKADSDSDSVSVSKSVSDSKKEIIPKQQIEIPHWIDAELWNGFVEMRKKIKKPLSEHAVKLILKDLERFERKTRGWGSLALENSIKGSWQGVFEPKQTQMSNFDKTAQACKEFMEEDND